MAMEYFDSNFTGIKPIVPHPNFDSTQLSSNRSTPTLKHHQPRIHFILTSSSHPHFPHQPPLRSKNVHVQPTRSHSTFKGRPIVSYHTIPLIFRLSTCSRIVPNRIRHQNEYLWSSPSITTQAATTPRSPPPGRCSNPPALLVSPT